ncbi:hypothetical protein PENSPDRAFT_680115 [Peniophora sp. CONT]|nr:hypothetical protein PENSPDRAFT_680115 [Peniophora sp. CONT]
MFSSALSVLALASLCAGVLAQTYTIFFDNKCGRGTPTLVDQNGAVLSTGGAYNFNGSIIGASAFLQTGSCGPSGENCCTLKINDDGAGPECTKSVGTNNCPAEKCSASGGNLVIIFCD